MRVYTGLDVNSDFGGRFPWKSRFIDHGGVKQAYVDEGPRDAKLTFLLVHGNPTWSYLYRKFIAALCPTYRVLAIDHVGFGRSDKPREPSYYTLERHLQNLAALMREANAQRVVPVVQDWGGPTGIGWAVRHAEQVAGVVVLNTWAFIRSPEFRLPWLFKWAVRGEGGWKRATRNNIFVELLLRRGGTKKLATADLDAFRAPHPTPEDRIGIARFPRLIPETHDIAHESWSTMDDLEVALSKLAQKPALVCWGMKDPAFREPILKRWLTVFQDVDGPYRLHAGHFLQEDAPEQILARLMPFAARLAGT